jgi:hypothetical protein
MKKITSLTLAFSFLVMTYTGIMLFICPHGRVAYWSDWHFLGLTKNQYGDLHTTSMLVFIFFGTLHIYYNWKPILSYLKNQQRKISFTKREFLVALSINLVFIAGTITAVQPFKAFLSFEEDIKESWTRTYGEPPYGHAEETKFKVFCQKMGINITKAKEILQKKHIVFNENEPLKIIAKNNHITPNDIYTLIKTEEEKPNSSIPSRLGRRTLQELNSMHKIDMQKAIQLLKIKGIHNITPQSKIKNIADELDKTPIELYQSLRKEK